MRVSRSTALATAAALTLVGLAVGCGRPADPETWVGAKARAAQLNKPLLIDFFTEW